MEISTSALSVHQRPHGKLEGLKALGFRYVTLDLEGFRSGSLNASLPLRSGSGPET